MKVKRTKAPKVKHVQLRLSEGDLENFKAAAAQESRSLNQFLVLAARAKVAGMLLA